MTREDIANKLVDEGWCPDSGSGIEYLEDEDGWLITKTMFISDQEIDDYIKENPDES